MTVAQLLASADSRELSGWMAYQRVEQEQGSGKQPQTRGL